MPESASTFSVSPWAARLRVGALVVLGIFCLSQILPWQPHLPAEHLDVSWAMGLNMKFLMHYDFGKEAFSFGPWGFIYSGYVPATYLYVLAAWTLIAAAIFFGACEIGRRIARPRWFWVIWMFVLFAVLGLSSREAAGDVELLAPDIRLFGLVAIFIVFRFQLRPPGSRLAHWLLVTALALTSLVKFSSFILAAIIMVLVTVDDLFLRRRFPWTAIGFAGLIVFFWLAAGQRLASLLPYLRHSFVFASGYAEAMSTWNPDGIEMLLLFATCCALLLAIIAFPFRASLGWALPLLAASFLIYFIYRTGFVRDDDAHMPASAIVLFAMALTYFGAMLSAPRKSLQVKMWVAVLICSAVLTLFATERSFASLGGFADGIIHFPQRLLDNASRLLTPARARQAYDQRLAELRQTVPLAGVRGTVDAYPWGESIILANGWRYDPRPVAHSYAAYLPPLLEMNAGFLRGPDAPDSVLFNTSLVDRRYPAEQDSLSWPELLSRYDIVDDAPEYLVMTRASRPRPYTLKPLGRLQARWGEIIAVPSMEGGPIWVAVDVHPGVTKPLFDLFFKPPMVGMDIMDAAGHSSRFRITPSVARCGFLLSPEIVNRHAFAALAGKQWKHLLADEEIKMFSFIEEPADCSAYEKTIDVTFSQLQFEHADLGKLPGFRADQMNQDE